MLTKTILAALFVGVLAIGLAAPALADPIDLTSTDYDNTADAYGDLLVGPWEEDFRGWDADDEIVVVVGKITGNVYLDDGLYTYVYMVVPDHNNFSEFNTSFAVPFVTGDVTVGWDYDEASTVLGDGTSSAFSVTQDDDGTVDWDVESGAWSADESITFFFQSNIAPGRGAFGVINGVQGSAANFAPVPEPTTLALLSLGALGLGIRRRRRNRA